MQDEVVWKINWETFKIALKVRCDKTISEFCCSEAFLHPPQQVVLLLVTAFSKQIQQSLFNRNSLSNSSAGNTRPFSKVWAQRHFFSLHVSHPYLNSSGLIDGMLFQKDAISPGTTRIWVQCPAPLLPPKRVPNLKMFPWDD